MRLLKVLLPLFAIILMVACNDEPYSCGSEPISAPDNGIAKLSEEARSLALEAMQWFGEPRSRSNGYAIDESSIESLIANDSRSSECDTLFQIINFQDSAGYAIVGNIGGRKQLLAAVNGGHLSLNDNNLPVQDAILLESARRYAVSVPIDTSRRTWPNDGLYQTKTVIDTLSKECVEPLIGLHWGQSGMYGEYCPLYVAGCFPVAVGQMMAYFRPQGKFSYTYKNADIPFEYINWDEINMHKGGGHNENQCPEEVHRTIPRILREIGERCEADYEKRPFAAGVATEKIRPTLSDVLPNCSNSPIMNFSYSSMMNTFKEGGIILILGNLIDYTAEKPEPDGHAWLAEGYRFYDLRYRFLRKPKDLHSAWGYEEPWEVLEEKRYKECYIYYNMGFEGKGDRFVLSDLNLEIMNNHGTYNPGAFHYNNGPFDYYGCDMQLISVKKQ